MLPDEGAELCKVLRSVAPDGSISTSPQETGVQPGLDLTSLAEGDISRHRSTSMDSAWSGAANYFNLYALHAELVLSTLLRTWESLRSSS